MSAAQALPVCVVGAGSSGMCAAKALHARGIPVEGFETGSDIGGMWRYENDNGLSSAYRSLHIDTSRRNLGYPDHPIPSTTRTSSRTPRCWSGWKAMRSGST